MLPVRQIDEGKEAMDSRPREKSTPGTDGSEKRAFQRYALDVRLRATLRKKGVRIAVHGRGNNISEGGLAAFLPTELVIGELVEMDVSLPYATQPLKVKAVVRNRRSFTYGLEFVDITPAQKAAIARTCGALELVQ